MAKHHHWTWALRSELICANAIADELAERAVEAVQLPYCVASFRLELKRKTKDPRGRLGAIGGESLTLGCLAKGLSGSQVEARCSR